MMEDYLQTEWPDLKVWFTSITEQWATIAINGPQAREILAPLVEGIDLSNAAFPHMSVREGRICGVPTRLARVSFTGELGFEVNVPADLRPRACWRRSGPRAQKRRRLRLRPRGAARAARREGLHHRRPGDRRHGDARRSSAWADGRRCRSRISSASARCARPTCKRPAASSSSACSPDDPHASLEEGAQIVADASAAGGNAGARPCHVVLYEPDARPLVRAGAGRGRPRAARARRFIATTRDGATPSKVVEPVFYDKEGSALTPDAMTHSRAPLGPRRPRAARQRRGQGGCSALRDALDPARRRRMSRRRVGAAFGVAAADAAAARGERRARAPRCGSGPDEWLLIAEDAEPGIGAQARGGAGGRSSRARRRLASADVRSTSAAPARRGCSTPASRSTSTFAAFPVGMVARTLLIKAEIVLWRREAERFRVEIGARSRPMSRPSSRARRAIRNCADALTPGSGA